MTKRPKRDVRRRWQRGEESAVTADVSARHAEAGGLGAALGLVLDHERLWEILQRYGIARIPKKRREALGIERIELRRIRTGVGLESLSSSLRGRLLSAIDDLALRTRAAMEIDAWVVDARDQALLRHAKAWVRRQSGGRSVADPRVPRFDHQRDGGLVFEPLNADIVWERREADLRALGRRVDEVVTSRSQRTIGDGFPRLAMMEWRILSPLLQWEESGFTERHWSELTDDELRAFVQAGIDRENILSNRDDDLTRVRQALRDRKPRARPMTDVGATTPSDEEVAWDLLQSELAAAMRRNA